MRMRVAARVALAVVTAAVPAALAQEITGTITGTVTDQTGGVMAGVTVTARNTGTGFAREVQTGTEGSYTVPLLPVGRYEVTFALTGFQAATAQNIPLHVNDRIQLNMVLKAGVVTETLEVTVGTHLIQPTPAVQSLMGPVQVQELPLNNRNFAQLATLVPGVTSSLADEVGVGLASVVSVSVNGSCTGSGGSFGQITGRAGAEGNPARPEVLLELGR